MRHVQTALKKYCVETGFSKPVEGGLRAFSREEWDAMPDSRRSEHFAQYSILVVDDKDRDRTMAMETLKAATLERMIDVDEVRQVQGTK